MDSSDDMIHIESRGWLKRGDAQKLGLIGAAATPTPNYEKCPLRPCPTEDACMNAGKCLNPNPSFDQLTRDRFSGEMNRPDPSVATEREALTNEWWAILLSHVTGGSNIQLEAAEGMIREAWAAWQASERDDSGAKSTGLLRGEGR